MWNEKHCDMNVSNKPITGSCVRALLHERHVGWVYIFRRESSQPSAIILIMYTHYVLFDIILLPNIKLSSSLNELLLLLLNCGNLVSAASLTVRRLRIVKSKDNLSIDIR